MKTTFIKDGEIKRRWWVIDAEGKPLGRLASIIAKLLQGKHKREYSPHQDHGDFVIVINAEKVLLTGNKMDKKIYRWHTGYIGGLKERTARQMMEKHPERVIMLAVKGMLPKNATRKHRLRRLRVYRGPEHPHHAQKPEVLEYKKGYEL